MPLFQVRFSSCSCRFTSFRYAAILLRRPNSYVNSDRARTKKIVGHAADRGVKALFITVDAPQLGRREKVRVSAPLTIDQADDSTGHADEVRRGSFSTADSRQRHCPAGSGRRTSHLVLHRPEPELVGSEGVDAGCEGDESDLERSAVLGGALGGFRQDNLLIKSAGRGHGCRSGVRWRRTQVR
jgi:hypothetical protein